jgi:protein transport protein SEC23
MPELTPS